MRAQETEPGPAALADLAQRIAAAEIPVIFAQHGAGNADGFAALGRIAERWGIPVWQYWALQLALPTDHPMAAQPDPGALLAEADLVICLDTLVPWMPGAHEPRSDAVVVQLGPDPLALRTPIRNFRADLAIPAEVGPALIALEAALAAHEPGSGASVRFGRRAGENTTARAKVIAAAQPDSAPGMTKAQVALALSDALKGCDATVLSELGCPMMPMRLTHPQAWYQEPHAGGLGWSFPAAMGMQLGAPDRPIVATMGDGSYMLANPMACHQIAEALNLPVLIIVLNNAEWGAVRQSVAGLYPDGHAVCGNAMPLTGLSPSPDFVKIAEASRAMGLRAARHEDFKVALAEALDHVAARRGPALIDVTVRTD